MCWYQGEILDLDLCFTLFKKQHKKYTLQNVLDELNITDFDKILTNVWNNSVVLIKNNQLEFYKNSNNSTFIIGYRDLNCFKIKHLISKNIILLNKVFFETFCKYINTPIITIRSRKNIKEYHDIILSFGFEINNSDNEYNEYKLKFIF